MRFGSAVPPGNVIIDIETDAQASNLTFGIPRDTSVRAGLVYQDTTTLKRYLSEPGHFWIFYHMDRGEPLALSHGAHKADLTNLFGGRVENARTTASGTGARTGTTQGSTGSATGALRDASPGSATLSSARVLPADSAARTATVVGATTAKPGTAAVSTARPLPTDTTARRTATVRTPTTPAGSVAGPLRDKAPGTATPSTSRVIPTDTASKLPEDARARSPRIADRRLSNVRTAPGPLGVIITFDATGLPFFNAHNAVRVEIEFEPPAWDARERRWSYPVGPGGHWYANVTGGAGGLVAQPWTSLEPGRRYYYLITLFATDSLPEAQRTGSFTAAIRAPLNGASSK
jgi:hypothetical protein